MLLAAIKTPFPDRITIGDRVRVGGNAPIVDFDFHPLTPGERAENMNAGAAAPS